MSEKIQRTTASTREKMLHRYDDGLEHKHNKNHHTYRHHCRSHPAHNHNGVLLESEEHHSTGLVRRAKLRRIKKRMDNGQIH